MDQQLPTPPKNLAYGGVSLKLERMIPADPSRGFVPAYHFRIVNDNGVVVGHINLRVGDTEHVNLYAGHIGYEITNRHRGHSYALQACRAIAPFVKEVSGSVIITCDPENTPSRITIERLGAEFLEEIPVPPDEPQYLRGSRWKRRYRWEPSES